MWFPTPELLAASTPANAFLACRWNEFFDSATPDTYRPRVCHLPVLVAELADAATAALRQTGMRKHLHQVKQECRARLAEESFFRLCTDADLIILTEMASETANESLIATKAQALRENGFAERYDDEAISRGQTEIVSNLERKILGKRAADRWLGLWATIALQRGYVWSSGFQKRDEQTLTGSVSDNVTAIATGLAQVARSYVCVVAISAIADPRMDTAHSAAHWLALAERVRTQLIDTPANLTVGDIMSNPRLRADQSPWGAR